MLTNNGFLPSTYLCGDWGKPKDDTTPEWHLYSANSAKQMLKASTLNVVPRAVDGTVIERGHVRTLYLQCGNPEENLANGMPNRFYTSVEEWRKANPEPEGEAKRLGPVIHT